MSRQQMINAPAGQTRDNINEILGWFHCYGNFHFGERITQSEHALQCAWFARQAGAGDELVAAALLHDLGHLITYHQLGYHPEEKSGDSQHEKVAADYLSRYFPDDVVKPVRLHVAAKRYRFSIDPAYRRELSDASIESLRLQGGEMDQRSRKAFEGSPWFRQALQLRQFDEMGKDPALEVPGFGAYSEVLTGLLLNR